MAESSSKDPTLEREQAAFDRGVAAVIGLDEVGRGAIAGPVAVGAHVVASGTTTFPAGLRDSKLLTEKRREALVPAIELWGTGAVGFVSATAIDREGIVAALAEAARQALLSLHSLGVDVGAALILLDGTHDWLSPALRRPLTIETMRGADRACASVAAASVRAKVARDAVMCEAHARHPEYAWKSNKGYGSRAHQQALVQHGATDLHRKSWLRDQ